MFRIGDMVMHVGAGVCTVADLQTKKFGKLGKNQYYVLKPLTDNHSTIFFPVENDGTKIRKLLTEADIDDLLSKVLTLDEIWIDDDRARQHLFDDIIKSGNHAKIIKMISEIHIKRETKAKSGKKLRVTDEKAMTDAEFLIHQEFSYALDLPLEGVAPYIMKKLNIIWFYIYIDTN